MSNPLDVLVADINRKYKGNLMQRGTSHVVTDRIQFSSPRMNYITYGGIPIGKSTELIGPEGGGKTTTAIDLVKNAQIKAQEEYDAELFELESEYDTLVEKNNKTDQKRIKQLKSRIDELMDLGPKQVVYVDTENTLDEDWARLNGVDVESLYLLRPENQSAEQVLQMISDVIDTGRVLLVALDSVPMLVSQNLYDKTMEDKSYGGIASALAEFSRRIAHRINRNRVAFVAINQVRDDLNNPYNQWHTPGGRAWRHFHSLRLGFRKGRFIDENNNELKNSAGDPAGNVVDVTIVKTKVCKPDRRLGFYTIKYKNGIDVIGDAIDLGIKYGFVHKAGAWFTMLNPETGEIIYNGEDELKFQGRASLVEYLREHEAIFEELVEAVNTQLNEG